MKNIGTNEEKTWCPGCANYSILESVKKTFENLIKKGWAKQEDFAITTDIGCNGKIFDYINVSGIYGLHGRAIPTALGITIGNPNLKVIAFGGDGGTYSEGIAHFMHAGRFNADMTLVVHDNQDFSLTVGQSTPTSQQGYRNKSDPTGNPYYPLNPLKIALAADIGFIARVDGRNVEQTSRILEKAIKYKGFSFVEVIQDCVVFNLSIRHKEEFMYEVDNKNKKKALALTEQWDYNTRSGKIPIGIIYQENKKTLTEKWIQLDKLKKKKIGWKGIK